ncbi:hypothetical protein RJ639_001715 [Escallonia herrerae]|uniref:Uncharacterized protein n=1 Tax=Escallonia herrerae TaxID=1293975 RepID=A0AA89BI65_9ASTE|nr:hypothetical protein RJ639_001715 [Escallonia herrerae]
MWSAVSPLPSTSCPFPLSNHTTNNTKKRYTNYLGPFKLQAFNNLLPVAINQPKSTSIKCSSSADQNLPHLNPPSKDRQNDNFWVKWRESLAQTSGRLPKLGLSAVLAYGIFDAVTYTTFFVLAFLGYEKSTGKIPLPISKLCWG